MGYNIEGKSVLITRGNGGASHSASLFLPEMDTSLALTPRIISRRSIKFKINLKNPPTFRLSLLDLD